MARLILCEIRPFIKTQKSYWIEYRCITITHAPDFFHLGSLDVQSPVAGSLAISVIHPVAAKLLDSRQSVQVKVRNDSSEHLNRQFFSSVSLD